MADPVALTLPAMGESVSEGIISRWLKAVGDSVDEGEPVVEVTTDKVDVEVPAPASGKLAEIVVAEGDTVSVGATLALIAPGATGGAGNGARVPAPTGSPAIRPAFGAAAPVRGRAGIAPGRIGAASDSGAGDTVTAVDRPSARARRHRFLSTT